MILSVSILTIGKDAATAVSLVKACMDPSALRVRAGLWRISAGPTSQAARTSEPETRYRRPRQADQFARPRPALSRALCRVRDPAIDWCRDADNSTSFAPRSDPFAQKGAEGGA